MKNKLPNIPVIGYGSGIAANNVDCGLGPIMLQKSPLLAQAPFKLDWHSILTAPSSPSKLAALPTVAKLNLQLAQLTRELTAKRQRFLILGGDHSSAIGTWSGVAAAIKEQGPLGLIWIDAHMDSHTPETTRTGNIHGMPLACLLGYGPSELTNIMGFAPKISPQHLCLIGVRSFETEEAELLDRLNVRIFYIEEVEQRGVAVVLQEALKIAKSQTVGYGISVDLDAIDPNDAPGVGKPEENGIKGAELCQELKIFMNDPSLLGLEIAEFNPNLDGDHKTEQLIKCIIESLFSIHTN